MRMTKALWLAAIEQARQESFFRGREEGLKMAADTASAQNNQVRIAILSGIGQAIQACAHLADNVGGLR